MENTSGYSTVNLDGVMKFLERCFREAQKDPKRLAKVSLADLAWVLDTLETVKQAKDGK